MAKLVVQAGDQLDSWGTPKHILDVVRATHGNITLDLASNPVANRLVKAGRYFSVKSPCPEAPHTVTGSVVWCNPPGGVDKVKWFWEAWHYCVTTGSFGAFLIFNLDHWRALRAPLRKMWVGLPRQRLRFVGAASQYNHPSGLVSTAPLVGFDGHQAVWGC